jgi:hypothetical protein
LKAGYENGIKFLKAQEVRYGGALGEDAVQFVDTLDSIVGELLNCRQKSDESVTQFARRLEKLGYGYDGAEKTKVVRFRFVDGVRSDISTQLKLYEPDTLEKAVEKKIRWKMFQLW